jgi:hypothetical protein
MVRLSISAFSAGYELCVSWPASLQNLVNLHTSAGPKVGDNTIFGDPLLHNDYRFLSADSVWLCDQTLGTW